MSIATLDMALAYANKRGWRVFPVHPRGKAPIGSLVPHGLKDATTDPELIKQWWAKVPNANIGLPTGIRFDVLDVDGPEGWRSLAQLVAEHGPLPSSPVVLTPREGAHYFFNATGAGNRAGFRPHLDWRGAGGYIVAPPSVGANGKHYEWIIPPAEVGLEPVVLRNALDAREQRGLSGPRAAGIATSASRYGRAALEAEVGRVAIATPGERNHQLNASAFAVGQLIAGGELDAAEAADALFLAATRAGLGERETVATIRSGMQSGAREPRRRP